MKRKISDNVVVLAVLSVWLILVATAFFRVESGVIEPTISVLIFSVSTTIAIVFLVSFITSVELSDKTKVTIIDEYPVSDAWYNPGRFSCVGYTYKKGHKERNKTCDTTSIRKSKKDCSYVQKIKYEYYCFYRIGWVLHLTEKDHSKMFSFH